MDRRCFLKSCALLAGAVSMDHQALAQLTPLMGEAKLKIGILSDIHIRLADQTGTLEAAFTYFRDHGVDGVLIAGDMADTGLIRQLKWVAETWERVFPKDKAPDGRHVEKLFIYGNHDLEGQNYGDLHEFVSKEGLEEFRRKEALVHDKAGNWKRIFKEKFQPIFIKEVKGYKFVGAHWGDWQHIPGMPDFMEEHRKELEGDKPFFYFQHAHPKNTCSGRWAWGQDNGDSTAALSRFPNCIAFSGHSHTILNDEMTLWQGDFISVGTSSLSYTYARGGRENTYVDGDKEKVPAQMPVVNQSDGRQGMLMTVYEDCITLCRHEFVYGENLGKDWLIPLPLTQGEKKLTFAYRTAHAVAPEFPAGSQVHVTRGEGKDRYGEEQPQLTVHFPNVLCRNANVRAYDFEVQVEMEDEDTQKIMLTKRVMSPHFYLGEKKDDDEVICVFGRKELPSYRPVRFVVRPVECFGKKGKAIYSDWMRV
ncbi:MAG: metallophosphoesterase family protein [Parabacteroides sp.]